MLTSHRTLTVSDLRKRTDLVMEELADLKEPVTVFSRSKPVAVMMSVGLYEHLCQQEARPDPAQAKLAMAFFVDPPKRFQLKSTQGAVAMIHSLRNAR